MSDRTDIAEFARDFGWTIETNGTDDTYTRRGVTVMVSFSPEGYAYGGYLNGVATHSGDDVDDWARYCLRHHNEMPPGAEPDWHGVHLVADDTGSHAEPELDRSWPDLWKLRWNAAFVSSRMGIWITVSENKKHPGWFGMSYRAGDVSIGTTQSYSFDQAWTRIVGMGEGFEIAQWITDADIAEARRAAQA